MRDEVDLNCKFFVPSHSFLNNNSQVCMGWTGYATKNASVYEWNASVLGNPGESLLPAVGHFCRLTKKSIF